MSGKSYFHFLCLFDLANEKRLAKTIYIKIHCTYFNYDFKILFQNRLVLANSLLS